MQQLLNFEPSRTAQAELGISHALPFPGQLATFGEFGKTTLVRELACAGAGSTRLKLPAFINEFWTAAQRQAHSLHEVSYRACFKPQLPRFFIQRLTQPGETVFDPFMGRGTTLLEAALLGRRARGCDINPLSKVLGDARLCPPSLTDVAERLKAIDLSHECALPEELLAFYHPATLKMIMNLRGYLLDRRAAGTADDVDTWLAMVAVNRLTGHSPGFFSVYTLPPNQAVSVKSQLKINERRKQVPPPRPLREIILKKSRQLLKDLSEEQRQALRRSWTPESILIGPAHQCRQIVSSSVALVVTSPPFLDVVNYAADNWLRCWFMGIDPKTVSLTVPGKLERWSQAMLEVFRELHRIIKPGGHVAFEVGEVKKGTVKLEEAVIPCGAEAGLEPLLVLINDQKFTKTANCWGVTNMSAGTNTNRIVVFRKP